MARLETLDGSKGGTNAADAPDVVALSFGRTGGDSDTDPGTNSGTNSNMGTGTHSSAGSGAFLAAAYADRSVRVWDVSALPTASLLRVIPGHAGGVWGVACQPGWTANGGCRVATCAADGTLRLWELGPGPGGAGAGMGAAWHMRPAGVVVASTGALELSRGSRGSWEGRGTAPALGMRALG